MIEDNMLKKITSYISVWGWQTLGIIFLTTSLVFFALPYSIPSAVFQISFFLIFIWCLYMTLKRKREFYNGGENE